MKTTKLLATLASISLAATLMISCSEDPDDLCGDLAAGGLDLKKECQASSSSNGDGGAASSSSGGAAGASSSSSSSSYGREGVFMDARDGESYRYVTIGDQVWMAENMRYVHPSGDSRCYDFIESNCAALGRLYDKWDARGACPAGWHLASEAEWMTLNEYADRSSSYLNAIEGWDSYQGVTENGIDKFGFSALPGGVGYQDSTFYDAGFVGYWWENSEDENGNGKYFSIHTTGYERVTVYTNSFLSARCVKGSNKKGCLIWYSGTNYICLDVSDENQCDDIYMDDEDAESREYVETCDDYGRG